QLVARRVTAGRGKPMPVRARQLIGLLARKGYPAVLAAQVVREALEQDQADSGSSVDLAWISEDGRGDDWAGTTEGTYRNGSITRPSLPKLLSALNLTAARC